MPPWHTRLGVWNANCGKYPVRWRMILFFFLFTVSNFFLFFFIFNKQGLGVFFLASLVFVYDKKQRAW